MRSFQVSHTEATLLCLLFLLIIFCKIIGNQRIVKQWLANSQHSLSTKQSKDNSCSETASAQTCGSVAEQRYWELGSLTFFLCQPIPSQISSHETEVKVICDVLIKLIRYDFKPACLFLSWFLWISEIYQNQRHVKSGLHKLMFNDKRNIYFFSTATQILYLSITHPEHEKKKLVL